MAEPRINVYFFQILCTSSCMNFWSKVEFPWKTFCPFLSGTVRSFWRNWQILREKFATARTVARDLNHHDPRQSFSNQQRLDIFKFYLRACLSWHMQTLESLHTGMAHFRAYDGISGPAHFLWDWVCSLYHARQEHGSFRAKHCKRNWSQTGITP